MLGLKKEGRRGWAKGFCIRCAKYKGYMMPQKDINRLHHKKKAKPNKKPAESVVKKEPSEDVEQNFQKKSKKRCKLLGSDAIKDLDSDEPQVQINQDQIVLVKMKKVPKTKEKPNLRKLGMEKNNNTKAERQWPKGVRICLGPLPLQRIPTRERCQGGNFQARATQQNCARARVASLTRTCSVNGCGNILCDECYA